MDTSPELLDLINTLAQLKQMPKAERDRESPTEVLDRCLIDPILRKDPLIKGRAKNRLDSNYKLQPEHDYDGFVCEVHW